MIDRVMTRAWIATVATVAIASVTASACHDRPNDALALDGNRLTVDNRTPQEWKNVEIWLNTYYRVTTPSIPPKGRFQAPLDVFVAGFGQRFEFRRMQVKDLRLTAQLPDGKPLELKYEMRQGGLAGVLGGAVGGKR
jgi:hypothetical protein